MIANFTFKELIHTNTAYDNTPNDINIIKNLVRLAEFLQTIRNELHLPIIVNSCYRSPEVNSAVGGTSNSYHCKRACSGRKMQRYGYVTCSPKRTFE